MTKFEIGFRAGTSSKLSFVFSLPPWTSKMNLLVSFDCEQYFLAYFSGITIVYHLFATYFFNHARCENANGQVTTDEVRNPQKMSTEIDYVLLFKRVKCMQ